MRANVYRLRDASFAILFNFFGQFHNARRFGGLHRKTPSPFPTARNETQRPPKRSPLQCPALMANIHLLPNPAARFGGTLCVTLSPFPTACDETQRPPKPYPFQCSALMANIHLLTALNSAVFSFRRGGSLPDADAVCRSA